MAMGRFSPQGGLSQPTAEINMTPMVDVMLVLLVIFIITVPLLTHSVQVELPQASSVPMPPKPVTLQVDIAADGRLWVEGKELTAKALEARFAALAAQDPRAELHVQADRAVHYESVAETMSAARRAGVGKIAFVTLPGR